MLEPFECGMGPPPCSRKHLRAAIALSFLIFFVCCSRRCANSFASALLTMSVLLLSTSFPLLLPKIRLFHKADTMEKPQVLEVIPPTDEPFQEKDAAEEGGEEDGTETTGTAASSTIGELVQQEDHSSHYSTSEDESSSDASISDDENLIELELPEGHYVEPKKPSAAYRQLPDFRGGFLPCFLPESVFRQHGFKELLSEINEEDNLIEIDIIRGSIKCPRLEIKV